MATESQLFELIELVYEASQQPEVWPQFLERYAEVFAADVSFIQRHWFAQHASRMLHTFGVSSPFRASYNEHYSRVNIWRDRGADTLTQGRVVVDDELCPRATLLETEFYNDYLVPMGAVRCVAGVVSRDGDQALMLAAMRGLHRSPFEAAERRALDLLLPHVRRARTIAERLGVADGMHAALGMLDAALLFVTADGRVVHLTAAAERIVSAGDGLAVRGGVITARRTDTDAQLRTTIRACAASRVPTTGPDTLLVDRPSLKRSFQLLIAPVRHGVPPLAGMRAPDVVVLIIDPDTQQPTAADVLMRLFRLTPREAALASALSTGMTVEQAADRLQMTYETARTHLRRIFSKTNTSRQPELMMTLARLPLEPRRTEPPG